MRDLIVDFDSDWKFHRGERDGAQKPAFGDKDWQLIALPHDFSAAADFSTDHASATGFLPGGIGWYRKQFSVAAEHKGRLIRLVFDGAQRDSDVWINGVHLGHRPNGYVGFAYDIGEHLHFGNAANVVAVRVERENVADSRWYPGTGIYRHVRLEISPPIHIVPEGVFVSTPRVTAERADIACVTEVANTTDRDTMVKVRSRVIDAGGVQVSETTSWTTVAVGRNHSFSDWQKIDKPKRWDIDNPALYTLETEVSVEGTVSHQRSTVFGIRQFHFDPNKGFFLNGRGLKLKGVCIHHDGGALGAAVPEQVWARRLMAVKDMGANAIRCAHNPEAPEFYSLCDRLGLLVMDEAFDEWEIGKRKWVRGRNTGTAERYGYSKDFAEWAERDTVAMVRQQRNHPSVIMWSIGNEIDYPTDPYVHAESRIDPDFADFSIEGMPAAARLSVVAPKLIAAVKREDPSRPVTMALANLPAANGTGLADMLDVAGYNYQEQHYAEDHASAPGRVIYGSENGKGLDAWLAVKHNDYISAQFIWSGFDFLGEAAAWPQHGSLAGLFDTAGFAKAHALQFEAWWKDEPVLHVVAKPVGGSDAGHYGQTDDIWEAWPHWSWPVAKGAVMRVCVISNSDRVELSLNGKSLGWKEPGEASRAVWDVPFEPGVLSARAVDKEHEAAKTELRSAGNAVALRLRPDPRNDISVKLSEGLAAPNVIQVLIEAIDDQGNVDPNFDRTVSVSIDGGDSAILALDNGRQEDPTALRSLEKTLKNGLAIAIVRVGGSAGSSSIRARALNVADGVLEF